MKEIIGTIASPKGFYADGIHCGVKKEKPILAGCSLKFRQVPPQFSQPIKYKRPPS